MIRLFKVSKLSKNFKIIKYFQKLSNITTFLSFYIIFQNFFQKTTTSEHYHSLKSTIHSNMQMIVRVPKGRKQFPSEDTQSEPGFFEEVLSMLNRVQLCNLFNDYGAQLMDRPLAFNFIINRIC